MTAEKKKNYVKNEPASIPRKKAKKMETSRDAWKEKNLEKQNSIKALKHTKVDQPCRLLQPNEREGKGRRLGLFHR
jgi:hypothetical protein